MQHDVVTRLRALARQRPTLVRRVSLVELRELAQLLGPTSPAATLLGHAEHMVNPHLFHIDGPRRQLVLVDAAPEDTLVLRRWW